MRFVSDLTDQEQVAPGLGKKVEWTLEGCRTDSMVDSASTRRRRGFFSVANSNRLPRIFLIIVRRS